MILKFNYKNIHQLPKIEKVTCNLGLKNAVQNKYLLSQGLMALELITGRRSKITISKKNVVSIAVRSKSPVGCKTTLRKQKCYAFLDLLNTLVLPKIKYLKPDTVLDNKGNYTLTIKNPVIFPALEEEYNKFKNLTPLNITINTTATNDNEAKALLSGLQLPVC